jgi:hypothetical protein
VEVAQVPLDRIQPLLEETMVAVVVVLFLELVVRLVQVVL